MKNSSMALSRQHGLSLIQRLMAASVFVVVAAGAAFDVHAQAGPGPGGPGPGLMMFGGSPERMGRGIDHMLDGLGVSDAQRTQIKQIAMAAAADLKSQREAGRALREQGMQVFAAPSVDAAAAESIRQQMTAQHDQASKRMLQAMLDASKVLTPEQRARMAQRLQERQAVRQERMQREHAPRPSPK